MIKLTVSKKGIQLLPIERNTDESIDATAVEYATIPVKDYELSFTVAATSLSSSDTVAPHKYLLDCCDQIGSLLRHSFVVWQKDPLGMEMLSLSCKEFPETSAIVMPYNPTLERMCSVMFGIMHKMLESSDFCQGESADLLLLDTTITDVRCGTSVSINDVAFRNQCFTNITTLTFSDGLFLKDSPLIDIISGDGRIAVTRAIITVDKYE